MLNSSVVLYFQATEEDGSSDEDLDDEAMMELDKGLSALFSEQKKKNQAKKDEKTKLQKEKTLVRDFKIKVPQAVVLASSIKSEKTHLSSTSKLTPSL